LRTGDLYEPFPEELNRVLTSRIARLHFAPTARAAENLAREGAPAEAISITGNTGIDAVLHIRNELEAGRLRGGAWDQLDPERKLVLVTAHRRESFGPPFERICKALRTLSRREDVQIVYPVHPNPNVQDPVRRYLSGLDHVLLIEPVGYVEFVDLMRRAHILLTDSGGIQEEGPSLGKPILVLRDKTERPEAVEAGAVRLVGSDEDCIVDQTGRLLDDPKHYASMTPVHNPYGDGRASERIRGLIASFFGK
jgi:UDP-N-acetylglucosamine 2-epimerase (non-hydrolysing)